MFRPGRGEVGPTGRRSETLGDEFDGMMTRFDAGQRPRARAGFRFAVPVGDRYFDDAVSPPFSSSKTRPVNPSIVSLTGCPSHFAWA